MLRSNAILQELRVNVVLQELRENAGRMLRANVVLQELRANAEGKCCSARAEGEC